MFSIDLTNISSLQKVLEKLEAHLIFFKLNTSIATDINFDLTCSLDFYRMYVVPSLVITPGQRQIRLWTCVREDCVMNLMLTQHASSARVTSLG